MTEIHSSMHAKNSSWVTLQLDCNVAKIFLHHDSVIRFHEFGKLRHIAQNTSLGVPYIIEHDNVLPLFFTQAWSKLASFSVDSVDCEHERTTCLWNVDGLPVG